MMGTSVDIVAEIGQSVEEIPKNGNKLENIERSKLLYKTIIK